MKVVVQVALMKEVEVEVSEEEGMALLGEESREKDEAIEKVLNAEEELIEKAEAEWCGTVFMINDEEVYSV